MFDSRFDSMPDGNSSNLPSLGQLLKLDELQAGQPEILTGLSQLRRIVRGVRGVHISEIASVGELVERDELVLTTGVALGESTDDLEHSVKTLVNCQAAGLVVKLSARFLDLPQALIDACDAAALPLIALRREVSLVRIAEAMCTTITDGQIAVLQMAASAHSTFTQLAVQGASVTKIVEELALMCECPAVFENLRHQVLAFGAAQLPVEDLLHQWEARSRTTALAGADPTWDRNWLDIPVEVRGQALGRLIILPVGQATVSQQVALERAATALVLNQMLEQNNVTLERQAHRSAVVDIINHRFRSLAEIDARVAALGFPSQGRIFLPVLVDIAGSTYRDSLARDGAAEMIAAAIRRIGVTALIGNLDDLRVAILLSLAPSENLEKVLLRVSEALGAQFTSAKPGPRFLIGTGPSAGNLIEVSQAFIEADYVLSAAHVSSVDRPYYDYRDIGIRALLHVLRAEPYVQSFVERTLGPLLDYDYRNKSDLIGILQAFLEHNGNKSIAADSTHVSRHTFYRRLATAQRILGTDLDSAETRTSVHAAILALESQRSAVGFAPRGSRSVQAEAQRIDVPTWTRAVGHGRGASDQTRAV